MIGYLNNKRAQSMLEYAVLMVVIIGALIAMQTYFKRGIQGRMKSSADDVGDQFSPDNTNVIVTESSNTKQAQTFGLKKCIQPDGSNSCSDISDPKDLAQQGQSITTSLVPEETITKSKSVIVNDQRENWGGS